MLKQNNFNCKKIISANETRDLLKISNCLERKKGNKRQIQMIDYNNLLPIVFIIIIQLLFIKMKYSTLNQIEINSFSSENYFK